MKEWFCPRCGATVEDFYITTPDPDAKSNCSTLHDDDFVECYKCRREWMGSELAKVFAQNRGRVKCPTCKGEGYIAAKGKKNK